MKKKELEEYVQGLREKGYTREAIRSILLTKGLRMEEIARVLSERVKKKTSVTRLLVLCVVLIVVLIPLIFLLTSESSRVSRDEDDEFDVSVNTAGNPTEVGAVSDIDEYECFSDDECGVFEYCFQRQCVSVECGVCEVVSDHSCAKKDCDDGDACTLDVCSNDACVNTPVTSCVSGDGCCPASCTSSEDSDCVVVGQCSVDGECDDSDQLTADSCNKVSGVCENMLVQCANDDGVCPLGCSLVSDNDCDPVCGNAVVEANEVCDGDCPRDPSECTDGNACTVDSLIGSYTLCTAECANTPVVVCFSGDGCCPGGCSPASDSDCGSQGSLFSSGSFTTVLYTTSGVSEVYVLEDGSSEVRFDAQFYTTGPGLHEGLHVYLATESVVNRKSDLDKGKYDLGALVAMSGSQEYGVPSSVDVSAYKSVVMYSSVYNAVYAYASLA